MKRSEFTKEFSVSGKNGEIKGEIHVVMNYGTSIIDYNNPSTHDTEKRTVAVHRIEAYIDNIIWWKDVALRSEEIVLSEVARCKKQMMERMTELANNEPVKSFADKFKEI